MKPTRTRPAVRVVLEVTLLALLLAAVPSVASAHFTGANGNVSDPCSGGGSGVNQADANTHKVRYVDVAVGSDTRVSVDWVIANEFDSTDLDTVVITSGHTDLKIRDLDYSGYCGYSWHHATNNPGGVVGLYNCTDIRTNDKCDTAAARFDQSFMDNTTQANQRALACHEFGHSLGLTHSGVADHGFFNGSGCMVTGYPKTVGGLGIADTDHIDDNF